ncbi:hypothetical protein [Pseudomonas sp. SLFW]|uniref:hypothetical protein n=1 Tax=Pseudomonas sp. SLFW TaxID=2683259 RepID=UPI001411D539|nr:hypothetical protein [Pseudomonas sp. SLFW]NBB10794.1 hypothetical protein [Pseudomonas sp. SLFW]
MSDRFLEWIALISGVIVVVSFCIDVYVKYFVLEKVEAQLKSCKIVEDARLLWSGSGFVGRRYRLVAVNLALTSTELLFENGLVDVGEVKQVPSHLRRWICIPDTIGLGGFVVGMIALALLGKLW